MLNEIWKPVVGFEKHYKISNIGRLVTLSRKQKMPNGGYKITKEKIVKPKLTRDGYYEYKFTVKCKRTFKRAHRVVAEAFLKNHHNYPQVNHKNGDKLDNTVDNLEWCTASYNISHALRTGLKVQDGEKNPGAKLTNSEVLFIKEELKNGTKPLLLAELYNVCKETIYSIKNGKTWKNV